MRFEGVEGKGRQGWWLVVWWVIVVNDGGRSTQTSAALLVGNGFASLPVLQAAAPPPPSSPPHRNRPSRPSRLRPRHTRHVSKGLSLATHPLLRAGAGL